MLRRTATSQRNSCTSSSAKLETSQTIHVPASTESATSLSGVCSLPARTADRPAASNIAPSSRTVVVFPFVPVTPRIGFPGSSRQPSSSSLQTGISRARAAAMGGASPGTPGLFTTTSTSCSRSSS